MAFSDEHLTYSKKINSTSVPATGGSVFNGELKDSCSILSPVLIFRFPSITYNPVSFNYAHVDIWGRWYFVDDWVFDAGRWFAYLSVDVLASWKTQIGASSQYILRSSSESNGYVIDTFYPAEAGVALNSSELDLGWANSLSGGYYVIGVINNDAGAVGATSYYILTQAQFQTLRDVLMSNTDWLEIPETEISSNLQKALINPIQYIASCMWFPFKPPAGATQTRIPMGWGWTFDVGGNEEYLSSVPYTVGANCLVPQHPPAETRGEYLNISMYTPYILEFQPFGQIALPSACFAGSSTLYANIAVDCISGLGYLRLYTTKSDNSLISSSVGQIGVPISLSQLTRNDIQVASTVLESAGAMVGGIATGDPLAGFMGVAHGVSGVFDALQGRQPQLVSTGSNGSVLSFYRTPRLTARFRLVVDEDNTNFGRPLCEVRTISEIPGFILVHNCDIYFPGTSEEIRRVVNFMNSGFYYKGDD